MFLSAAAVGLLGASHTALAQDARGGGLEEIVVTAQKREQSIQDVPISVTALIAEDLKINRVQNVADLDSVSPALSITSIPAGNAGPVYSMRGVIAIGTASGADKGVALYLDGVYIGAASGSAFDLAEIERIEVLKGPQGTLFGRNSTGGAVSITTRGPRGEFRFHQKFTYGNFDQFQSVTRFDTPQIGPVSAAFTYAHSERRGDIRNLGAGTVWDGSQAGLPSSLVSPGFLGNKNSESFAVSVRADISPSFDLIYKFDHSKRKFTEQGVGQIAEHPLPVVDQLNAASGFPIFVSKTRPDALNNWATVPSRVKAEGHVLTANWQISDNIRFKNVLAYRKSSYFGPLNDLYGTGGLFAGPQTPFFTIVTLSEGGNEQWSEEFQVDFDSSLLHLTAGGIWYNSNSNDGGAGAGYNSIAFLAAPNFVLPTTPVPTQNSTVEVTSYAAYAHAEVHVANNIDLVAGARFTDDKKRGIDRSGSVIGDLNFKDSAWTYDVGVNFKPSNDILLYTKYATGYISGGKLGTLVYFPEKAKSWEAGIKADWFDNRLRTNLSVYTVKYEDLQIAAQGFAFGVEASQVLVNAGDARARGFELETTFKPVDPITLGANLSYLDFKYTHLDPRYEATGQTIASQRPKWVGQFSAQYRSEPVFGDAFINIRADANFRSAHDGTSYPSLRDEGRIPASWIVNGVAALEDINFDGAKISISAWVKNLFDEDAPRYVLLAPFSAATTYVEARTFGLDLTFEF